jgi:hypothetical protein
MSRADRVLRFGDLVGAASVVAFAALGYQQYSRARAFPCTTPAPSGSLLASAEPAACCVSGAVPSETLHRGEAAGRVPEERRELLACERLRAAYLENALSRRRDKASLTRHGRGADKRAEEEAHPSTAMEPCLATDFGAECLLEHAALKHPAWLAVQSKANLAGDDGELVVWAGEAKAAGWIDGVANRSLLAETLARLDTSE